MNSLLYIATNPIDLGKLGGIEKKILSHCKCFSFFFKTTLINYSACYEIKGDSINVIQSYTYESQFRRNILFKNALDVAKKSKCNVYIRYPYTDPLFLNLCRHLKKLGCRIIIEIPTYPYSENHGHKLRSYLRLWVDGILSKFLRRYVERIVTYSNDKEIFGIKTINTINGVDFSNIKLVPFHNRKKEIHLISVAHLYSCHGYDRVIKGMAKFLNTIPETSIYFHIVGEGEVYDELRLLTSSLKLNNYVIFHGYLSGKDLDDIYNNSDIAVNSLAIHRIGLKTESTLKAKEYCAKGLPIVTAFELDSLSPEDNKNYTLKVPLNDEPVNILEIVSFYKRLKEMPYFNNMIREHSRKICDMPHTLDPIIKYFQNE